MSSTHSAILENCQKAKNAPLEVSPRERKNLAIAAIAKTSSVTELAKKTDSSRKFIYAQKDKAQKALDAAFIDPKKEEEKVLFYLPVTKSLLKQIVIGLILCCRSSYEGVIEFLRDIMDYSISKGGIHNIMHEALRGALEVNANMDLSKVCIGAHDEIFQAGSPVLVGCDAKTTYCYLLKEEEHRDGNTWGYHLLNLSEKQKLKPQHTVADGGSGLRKGQQDAWPNVPCHGDVFHALKPLLEMVVNLENRALGAMTALADIVKKQARPMKFSEKDKYKEWEKKRSSCEEECAKALTLADDVRTLYIWMREDILCLVGPDLLQRKKLLDFVVQELITREALCPHRIKPVRTFLENHKDDLLAFMGQIDKEIQLLSETFEVSPNDVRQIYEQQGMPLSQESRWKKGESLLKKLGHKFHPIETEIKTMLRDTVRASSVVENLNSRLRVYFTLRRVLGKDYLAILQYYLNHRRFMRSECEERMRKSPRELMTGETHPHWLEILGFQRFKQAA